MDGTTPQAVAAIDTFREPIPIGGLSANRWSFATHDYDHETAIDGDSIRGATSRCLLPITRQR